MDLPLCKMSIFLEFFRTFLSWSKKHSFLFRILKNVSLWLFLLKKNIRGKGRFFEKNHGLNALQNVDFFDFFRTSLCRSKKHSFLSRISKNVSFRLFLVKKKLIRKRSNFDKNHGLTPLQNTAFFYFARVSLFRSKKHSLLSRISKYASFLVFLLKKIYDEKVNFLTKTMD